MRIYEGQLAALRWTGRASSDTGRKIAAMARSEREHNATFDRMIAARKVRPTRCRRYGAWRASGWASRPR